MRSDEVRIPFADLKAAPFSLKANGAPGRGAVAFHVMLGYQACTLSLPVSSGAALAAPGLTWHASRGWSRVGT